MDPHDNLLTIRGLTKSFRGRGEVPALQGVDLDLRTGRSLGIVGTSGAGKSTLARCIVGLEEPTSGEILLDGCAVNTKTTHHRIQLIFQDPGASLNPRFTVAEALEEPQVIRRDHGPRPHTPARLRQVGLPETVANRRTSQLSGGQKARLALARALAALDEGQPGILILDESLASLDLSVQAQIINLLVDLQAERALSYILIAHDLSLAAHLADEVAVMFQGEIVERGAPRDLFTNPRDPHWRQLLSATLGPYA
jgi:peptide/nickel transport system ATP-binding protein